MKHLNKILCVTTAIAAGSSYAIAYVGGRQGMPLSLGGFPAEVAPTLISLLCLASLVVMLVIALIKRRPAGKTSVLLVVAFLIFALGFALAPATVFQAGFRHKIKSTVSPDELRQIARSCHATLPPRGRLPGPRKWSLWNESEHRPQWNALVGSSSLGKLDPSLTIFNNTDMVEIAWGGALVGHWGLIIQTDGKTQTGDIAEGIKTFISSE
ncbi:MAG TPA: hypothetical protein VNZ64_19380 [Candidatus Acidoferrum sp.]|nr:hypothetical protein [Candidatus Acidoferrum sp.]